MSRRLRAVSVVVLAALIGVLSACGGKSSDDVQATLDKAFSTPIRSANVNLDVTVKLDGVKQLNGPVKLSVQGPYETGGKQTIPKVDFDVAASAAGQNFSAGFISTGTNAWVGFQGQDYEIGSDAVAQVNKQIRQASGKKKQGFSQFGIDPSSWLTGAKDEGTDSVAGVETQHVSAALDVSAFLADINKLVAQTRGNLPAGTRTPQLTPADRKQIEDVVKDPRFDVYVGKDDNLIRRLSADVNFDVPKDKRGQVNGMSGGALSFSIDFGDVGKPQTITPPSSSKPLSELTSQLGGFGGVLGAGGSGAGGSSGGSNSSGPSAAALQAYSKCLQKADPRKPAELQKCADLLK